MFVEKVFREQLTSMDRLLKKINSTGATEHLKGSGRPRSVRALHVGISENIELVEELICSHKSAWHVYKDPYKIGMKMDILRASVRRIAEQRRSSTENLQALVMFTVIRQMTPLYLSNYEVMLRIK